MDTDLLLALLESSLPPGLKKNQSDLLEALVLSGGDVSKAADLLTNSGASTSDAAERKGSKRKASSKLDEWVKSSRRRVSDEPPLPTTGAGSPNILTNEQPEASTSSHKPLSTRKREGTPLPSAFDLLKDKSPLKKAAVQHLPPLILATPDMITKHTPTTLHTSILPAELACQLYYFMLNEAESWSQNKWYINERLVESPHTTSFYTRMDSKRTAEEMDAEAKYWYNGRTHSTRRPFPEIFEQALKYVEPRVREQMAKRERFALEWGGDGEGSWSANVAAANCYKGSKQGVGPHADHLTYLGPYPTIASISLGTTRMFRLREVIPADEKLSRQAQTFDIPLPHNSLLVMHPPTQEHFKHSIPPSKSIDAFRPPFPQKPGNDVESRIERINITFRFFRPDYRPTTIPTCKCLEAVPEPLPIPPSSSSTTAPEVVAPKPRHVPAVLKSNAKRRGRVNEADFYWQCNAGAQNGVGCKMWKPMDGKGEGRGPFAGDIQE